MSRGFKGAVAQSESGLLNLGMNASYSEKVADEEVLLILSNKTGLHNINYFVIRVTSAVANTGA
jgi:hypothetical protein